MSIDFERIRKYFEQTHPDSSIVDICKAGEKEAARLGVTQVTEIFSADKLADSEQITDIEEAQKAVRQFFSGVSNEEFRQDTVERFYQEIGSKLSDDLPFSGTLLLPSDSDIRKTNLPYTYDPAVKVAINRAIKPVERYGGIRTIGDFRRADLEELQGFRTVGTMKLDLLTTALRKH